MHVCMGEVAVKLKELQEIYCRWSSNTSGDVLKKPKVLRGRNPVNFQWCFMFLNPFGALGAHLHQSLVFSRSYNTFLKDPVISSFILILQWPFLLFLAQGLQ